MWLSVAIPALLLSLVGLSLTRASAAIVPVTGVRTGIDSDTGALPPRLRLQDLQASGPQWDLYIQALVALQSLPEDNELSYLGLSGIHGRPYVSWNGVEQVDAAPLTGYCTHNDVLFAIWHRPLVALFEQTLARHVQMVASMYTGSEAEVYQKAADSWRHPYWDWAADKALPDIVMQPLVTVQSAQGPLNLSNPLLTYRFRQFPLNTSLFPWSEDDFHLFTYPETLRCPNPATNQSNPGMASANVGAIDLAHEVFNIYARVSDFERMSSTAFDSRSFEQVHNEIHVAVGGLHPMGHFAHLGYSGFDPIFMLHHAAIDRHVALWQAVHFDAAMFTATHTSVDGQYATAPGTLITPSSPLKPFYEKFLTNGTPIFHTSESSRDTSMFGYTYPELLKAYTDANQSYALKHLNNDSARADTGGNHTNREALETISRAVVTQINALYGQGSISRRTIRATGPYPLVSYSEFFVRVAMEKEGIELPAVVNLFLGSKWTDRVLLTTAPVRGRVHGEISLQNTLLAMDMEETFDSIRQNLHWQLCNYIGEEIPVDPIQNLTIQLLEEEVTPSQSMNIFPSYRASRFATIFTSTHI